MAEINGVFEPRYAAVAGALSANLDAGLDVGASVAAFAGGVPVVDIWGGFADSECTTPWERDTITDVFSTTKTMTALCALILADRGELDVHAPVARYWPEFIEEVATPLGADFHIGPPADDDARVAPLVPHAPIELAEQAQAGDIALRSLGTRGSRETPPGTSGGGAPRSRRPTDTGMHAR